MDDCLTGKKDYLLAASQEISEFHEAFGQYRWWGGSPKDLPNCRTELVDAWHFIMSDHLANLAEPEERNTDPTRVIVTPSVIDRVANYYVECWNEVQSYTQSDDREVTRLAKLYQSQILSCNAETNKFFSLCIAGGQMTLEHLYARYVGKATLNKFRQDNGYSAKPRTYQKIWQEGKEDNYYLAAWIDSQLEGDWPAPSAEDVTAFLTKAYAEVKG